MNTVDNMSKQTEINSLRNFLHLIHDYVENEEDLMDVKYRLQDAFTINNFRGLSDACSYLHALMAPHDYYTPEVEAKFKELSTWLHDHWTNAKDSNNA